MTIPPGHQLTRDDPGAIGDLMALAAVLGERGYTAHLAPGPVPCLAISHPTVREPQHIYADGGFFQWNDPQDRRLAFCDREPDAIPHAAHAVALLMTVASVLDDLDAVNAPSGPALPWPPSQSQAASIHPQPSSPPAGTAPGHA